MGSEHGTGTRISLKACFTSRALGALFVIVACALPHTENARAEQCAAGRDTSTPRVERGDTAHNSRGFALLGEKRFLEAAEHFRRAIALNPARKEYHNNLAVALMNAGDYAGGRASLECALALDAAYPRALANMAVCCFHLCRFRESYLYYRLAQEADARYARERFERARVLARIEDLSRKDPGNESFRKIASYLRAMPPERPVR